MSLFVGLLHTLKEKRFFCAQLSEYFFMRNPGKPLILCNPGKPWNFHDANPGKFRKILWKTFKNPGIWTENLTGNPAGHRNILIFAFSVIFVIQRTYTNSNLLKI